MDSDEVRTCFDDYLADFAALGRGELTDVRRILAHYGLPLLVSTDAGSQALRDEEQVVAFAQQQVDGMRAIDYDRSEVLTAETAVLNESFALHRVRLARLRADGSEIGRLQVTYLVTDGAAGRRISGLVVHSTPR